MPDHAMEKKPYCEGLWTEADGDIRLLGSRCEACGEVYFPRKGVPVCAHCQSDRVVDETLRGDGAVHSYTVVHQPPAGGYYRGPVPFIYGIVELDEGVLVPAHILGEPETHIRIGSPVRAVIAPLYEEDGVQVTACMFVPREGGGHA